MNETKHTPGPWIVEHTHKCTLIWAEDLIIAESHADQHDNHEANAAHIVKCVNAHDGMLEALKIIAGTLNPKDKPLEDVAGEIALEAIKEAEKEAS